jgi:urease accessory protein UreF
MKKRLKLVAGAGAALAVAGGGAAIAANGSSPQAESQAVVNDAAKQLGVDPARLSDALKQALANRVDAAVKAGTLTEAQGKELKARIQADAFPLFGGRGGHHRLGFGHDLDAAAAFLGLSEAELRASLRTGETLAAITKEQGKSVDGLVSALVADKTKELDAAVTAGRLTEAQRDEIVSRLQERITALVNGVRPAHRPGFGGRHGFGGPAFGSEQPPAPRAA